MASQHQRRYLDIAVCNFCWSDVFLICANYIFNKWDGFGMVMLSRSYCQSVRWWQDSGLYYVSTCQQYQVCPEGSCFNAKPKKQDNNTTCVIFLVLFFNSDFEQYRIHQIKTKTHCKIVKLSSHCNPGVSNKKKSSSVQAIWGSFGDHCLAHDQWLTTHQALARRDGLYTIYGHWVLRIGHFCQPVSAAEKLPGRNNFLTREFSFYFYSFLRRLQHQLYRKQQIFRWVAFNFQNRWFLPEDLHLNGKFTPENHYQIGWFSHEGHSFESYYYTTINDNNATALGLSTMVISQKALMVVQHCRLSYVREHVSHCFLLFLYVSPIYVTEQNVFLLHSTGKTSQRHFEGLFMM